jgi:ribosomal protein RSM22 (predicted rRNA methylase)
LQLPRHLATAIEEITAAQQRGLAAASRNLSERYERADFSAPALRNSADHMAYLVMRFPATLAALTHVFRELKRLLRPAGITTLLDLGAGPGTAVLAAAEVFSSLKRATLLEADAQWLQLGKKLAAANPFGAVRGAEWVQRDLASTVDLPPHDVVVLSYALGELPVQTAQSVMRRAWKSAQQFLLIIEPGTVRGFNTVHNMRMELIAHGAEILAPCPHKHACPMAQAADWCHFAQRVERTPQHRRAKGGSLGYEDAKFSYVIASREPFPPAQARIVRHPQKHSGHVQLVLCTPEGLRRETITASHPQLYKPARRAAWGDVFPLDRAGDAQG